MNKIKQSKNAFTLIELIIVMIIIGILVLLAAPRFLRYIEQAKYTNIIYDIKVVESVSNAYMAKENKFPKGTSNDPFLGLKDEIKDKNAYLKDGLIVYHEDEEVKNFAGNISETYGKDLKDFYKLSKKEFVKPETKSRLKGSFYINKDGRVLYIDNKALNEEPGEPGEPSEPEEPEEPSNPEEPGKPSEPENPEDKEAKSEYHDMFIYDRSNPSKIIGRNRSDKRWKEDFEEEDGNPDYITSRLPEIPKYRKVEENGNVEYIKITEIKDIAFLNIKFIGEFKAPYIEKIGDSAFLDSKFEGELDMPNLKIVGKQAFIYSEFEGEFKIPNIETIKELAFRNSKFTGAFKSEKVTSIERLAFLNSKFNEGFEAPKLKTIGDKVFIKSEFSGTFKAPNIQILSEEAFNLKPKNSNNPTNIFDSFEPNLKDKHGRMLGNSVNKGYGWSIK